MYLDRKLTQLLLVSVLLISALGPTAAKQAPAAARLHPLLAQIAADSPEQGVAVIVQKATTSGQAEALAAQLGGVVTQDLHILNAFAAEMTAGAARELAASPAVRWVSVDAPVQESGGPDGTRDTKNLLNAYIRAVGADKLWAQGYQGSSVTVAVVDSGMNSSGDYRTRILTKVKTNSYPATTGDNYGHGTHVAGIIAGDGANSGGKYVGVAPQVKLVSVKVSDDQGRALTSDAVAGLQWVLENETRYNIRVVALSLNSSVAEPYATSPLSAAVEILWFNGIVVVVSGGNNGASSPGLLYPPANDPFVISVGAVDDKGTASLTDDTLANFSAFGTTESGFSKPDLVAPGKNNISALSSSGSVLPTQYPSNKWNSNYLRMSGTSMSAPVVAGAVALLLQDEPNLTPDQVKYRLMATARPFSAGNRAGYLDIYAAVHGTTTESANTGVRASQLLWTGSNPLTWGSVNWNSASWNSASWNSVSWNSASWNSVTWNSDYWGP